jgi:hypothetical protein
VTSSRYNGMIHDIVLLNAIRDQPKTQAALQQASKAIRDALTALTAGRAAPATGPVTNTESLPRFY